MISCTSSSAKMADNQQSENRHDERKSGHYCEKKKAIKLSHMVMAACSKVRMF